MSVALFPLSLVPCSFPPGHVSPLRHRCTCKQTATSTTSTLANLVQSHLCLNCVRPLNPPYGSKWNKRTNVDPCSRKFGGPRFQSSTSGFPQMPIANFLNASFLWRCLSPCGKQRHKLCLPHGLGRCHKKSQTI